MTTNPEKAVIDIRRLRYFIAVCEHGGFSKASQTIGIAQPSLTRQVKLLETEVGLPLLSRNGRGAEPTEEGKFLLARSVEHITGLENAVRDLRYRFAKLEGQAVLGICPTITQFFRDDLESWVAANAPKSSLSIIEAYSGDLNSLMESRRIDLALTYKPARAAAGSTTELFSERLVLVRGYDPQAEGQTIELGELGGYKLILPSRMHELRRIIDRVCQRHGVFFKADLELDSLDAVKALLMKRSLNYHTILPARSVAEDIAAKRLSGLAIGSTEMMRTIVVMERDGGPKPPLVKMLHSRIVELARSIGAHSDCIT